MNKSQVQKFIFSKNISVEKGFWTIISTAWAFNNNFYEAIREMKKLMTEKKPFSLYRGKQIKTTERNLKNNSFKGFIRGQRKKNEGTKAAAMTAPG